MFTLHPLVARLRRKLQDVIIQDVASETLEISPSIESNRPPAIFASRDLERIQSSYEPLDVELSHILGGTRREGATIGYAIDDAILSCGVVYKDGKGIFLRSDAPKIFDYSASVCKSEAVLVTNAMCEQYFGHWLAESPLMRMIAKNWQKPSIQLDRKPYLHQLDYEKIIQLPAEAVRSAHIERLWVINDGGMNEFRRARTIELRKRIRSSARPRKPIQKVFMLRGTLGKGRRVVNHNELAEFVKQYGFVLLNPELASVQEIVNTMCQASFVLTVEGSAQKHALMAMPPRSCLIIIQPANRFTAPGKNIADLLDVTYAFTIADSIGKDIRVDLPRLAELFAMVGV